MNEQIKSEVISAIHEGRFNEAVSRIVAEMSVKSPSDTVRYLAPYMNRKQEHFIVMTLDGAHKTLKTRCITKGLVNRTLVHPREVFRCAISDNAAAIVLAHNHPSGSSQPSSDDLDITNRIMKAGELMGIPVIDHIIVGKFKPVTIFV